MTTTQCAICTFFFAEEFECRRFPPVFHEFSVVRPTDWCGEFKEAQTKPSLFTKATTAFISASLPAASETKLRKHKSTLEGVIRNAPSKRDAERLTALLNEVEHHLAAAYARRGIEEAERETNRPTLKTASRSITEAIDICKEAKKRGFTWPREAAEFVNCGPILDDDWKTIAPYWVDAWDRMLVGE